MPASAKSDPRLAHMVYFTMKDRSAAAVSKLLAACHRYLTDHPGVLYFSVGTLSDVDRPICDRQFDVALHLVFQNRQAHDAYLISPRHEQFLAEEKPNFTQVRAFDSYLS